MIHQITLTQADDWHVHLRDGAMLPLTVAHSARQFARAIIMPNLKPPVTRIEQAHAYYQRIIASIPDGIRFEPLMTLYLTDNTTVQTIEQASLDPYIYAIKLYPAGATTHSDAGISRLENTYPVLEKMQQTGLPLLIHGEVTDPDIDIFDREKVFIERHLIPLQQRFPELKIVLEHITTQEAVQYIEEADARIGATITAHHLLFNRNDMLVGGIHPHYYCLPVLKRNKHQQALQAAVASGSHKFFAGTDSAPHARANKQSVCGCAGIYSAPCAMELYAQAFEQINALDKLEGFCAFHGADFYQLPRNTQTITLKKQSWQQVEEFYDADKTPVVPIFAGQPIHWKQI